MPARQPRGNQHSRVLACSVRRICELSRVESVSQRRRDVSSAEHWSFMRPLCGRVARVLVHGPWRGHARGHAHGPVASMVARPTSLFYTGFSTSESAYTSATHAQNALQSYTAIHAIQLYSYTALYTIHTLHPPSDFPFLFRAPARDAHAHLYRHSKC